MVSNAHWHLDNKAFYMYGPTVHILYNNLFSTITRKIRTRYYSSTPWTRPYYTIRIQTIIWKNSIIIIFKNFYLLALFHVLRIYVVNVTVPTRCCVFNSYTSFYFFIIILALSSFSVSFCIWVSVIRFFLK